MMWCTPEHAVFYGGVLHPTGKRFEIKPEDADEMKAHGRVEVFNGFEGIDPDSIEIDQSSVTLASSEITGTDCRIEVEDKPKRGRPKRNEM